LAAFAAAPAYAGPPKPHPHPAPKPHCGVQAVGFNASGTLTSHTLVQTAGAATAARADDRYSGTITVTVKRANHRAPAGEQTYTVDNGRARFYDADRDGAADAPKAGDRVRLHGRITRQSHGCTTAFTATVTVRSIRFRPAKEAS
jgi:hypothetical protein